MKTKKRKIGSQASKTTPQKGRKISEVARGTKSSILLEQSKTLPSERSFAVERTNGKIAFGNGTKGKVPPLGSAIEATYSPSGYSKSASFENDPCKGLPTFERNNYFYGKLLNVNDFKSEQEYFISKQRIINRFIHGKGIVCGFLVTKGDLEGTIEVSEGFALDDQGRELLLNTKYICDLNQKFTLNELGKQRDLFVAAKYEETKVNPVPSFEGGEKEFNMIREGAKIEVNFVPPDPSANSLFLAKIGIKVIRKKLHVEKIENTASVGNRVLSRIVIGRKKLRQS